MSTTVFVYALMTAMIWGVVPILEKLGLQSMSPNAGLYARSLGVLIGIALFSFIAPPIPLLKGVPAKSILLLLLGGFLASFVGQFILYRAIKMGEVSRVIPVSASYPLFTFFLSLLILGEPLKVKKVIGALLAVAGVILLK